MQIQVRYFAGAREAVGLDSESIAVDEGTDVAGLLDHLVDRHPALAPHAGNLRFAVGESFAEPGTVLGDGAAVALIPPVGGG